METQNQVSSNGRDPGRILGSCPGEDFELEALADAIGILHLKSVPDVVKFVSRREDLDSAGVKLFFKKAKLDGHPILTEVARSVSQRPVAKKKIPAKGKSQLSKSKGPNIKHAASKGKKKTLAISPKAAKKASKAKQKNSLAVSARASKKSVKTIQKKKKPAAASPKSAKSSSKGAKKTLAAPARSNKKLVKDDQKKAVAASSGSLKKTVAGSSRSLKKTVAGSSGSLKKTSKGKETKRKRKAVEPYKRKTKRSRKRRGAMAKAPPCSAPCMI